MHKSYAIVEDHTLFAQALQLLLSTIHPIESCSIYSDPMEFLEVLPKEKFDVIFVDLNMPKMNGIDLIMKIKHMQLNNKILVVSMINDPTVILKSLDAGADGFVSKNTQFNELQLALKTIEKNEIFIPENLQYAVENARRFHDTNWEKRNTDTKIALLSDREKEILKLIAAGNSNAEIAEVLFLSPLTIKTHRTNILRKLGLKNSIALVSYVNKLEGK